MYSYTAAGAVAKKRLRIVRGTATVDKDVTYGYGSDGKLATVLYPDTTVPLTYTWDAMDRPVGMTGPGTVNNQVEHVKDVTYGVAGQLLGMKYMQGMTGDYTVGGEFFETPYFYTEQRSYNELFQLTRQTTSGKQAAGPFGPMLDLEYVFSATANNGRITHRKSNLTGAQWTVAYGYDSLNRLESAVSTGVLTWGQTFAHDGFGNLRGQTATSGVAPNVQLDVDLTNNRMTSAGWSYDANGNATGMPVVGGGTAILTYDVDNRLTRWAGPGSAEEYGYLPDNKRVWKKAPSGAETVYLYGAGGEKLVTYSVVSGTFGLNRVSENVYFAGRLIRADGEAVVQDRLGSVVLRNNSAREYFPYGEEIGTATAGNVDKFGTYHRDQTTGLDYADQRYFTSALGGRFLTADPYEASGCAKTMGSNRFAYANGDPIFYNDPRGLYANPVFGPEGTELDDWLGYSPPPDATGQSDPLPTYVLLSRLQLPSGWSYDCVDSMCNQVQLRVQGSGANVLSTAPSFASSFAPAIAIGGAVVAAEPLIVGAIAGIVLAKTIEWWWANREPDGSPKRDDCRFQFETPPGPNGLKTCVYKCKWGGPVTFPQYADKPCPGITSDGLVDTRGLPGTPGNPLPGMPPRP
jgi:RHS repeat-associated protein